MTAEGRLQLDLVNWLKDEHPDVMFHCDLSSGAPLGPALGAMNARLQMARGFPDIYIFKSKVSSRSKVTKIGGMAYISSGYTVWHGLFLELKTPQSSEVKVDGTVGNGKHVMEQRRVHEWFEERDYKCCFAVGLPQAKEIINEYLS